MIREINDPREFEALRPEWNALLAQSRSDCLFLTWEWLHTWWKHLAAGQRLSLLRCESEGDLAALIPLAIQPVKVSRFQGRSLGFLGTGSVGSDYLDFIVRRDLERTVCDELSEYLVRRRIPIELSQVDASGSLAAGMAKSWAARSGSIRQAPIGTCPRIELAGHTWDSYLATLGPAHRYNVRRRLRQLGRRFDVRFEQVLREPGRREALAHLVSLHNVRRETRGGSNAFHTRSLLAFHDEITFLALQKGWLRLFTLSLNNTPAASVYGFLYNEVFYFYQCGFDPAYENHSVGMAALGLSIQAALAENARVYDLLHGDERYKFHWATGNRQLARLELYPQGFQGCVQKYSKGANRALRRMVRRVLSISAGALMRQSAEKLRKNVVHAIGQS
jgi:CelD/BcsL family acetyltransferase involved in cellulose biosynthesis